MLGAYPDQASVVDFFFAFNNLLGTTLHALRGGLSRYPEAVAKLVDVRTGCRVRSVRDRGRDVEVVWQDEAGVEHGRDVAFRQIRLHRPLEQQSRFSAIHR